MKIAFICVKGRLARLKADGTHDGPSEFFYGCLELREQGHHVELLEVDPDRVPSRKQHVLDSLFNRGLLPNRVRGWVLLEIQELLPKLRTYDVVIAASTGTAFALGLYGLLGRCDIPVVAIHCGIFNYPPNSWRRWLMSRLLRRMWTQVFGQGELRPMRETFRIPEDRIAVNQFGVDTDFWRPAEPPVTGDYVLSIGNDARRDYQTLLQAAPDFPCELRIITRLPLPEPLPANVEVIRGSWHNETVSDEALRTLYREARCVVITTHNAWQPSGQSAALQAMACGTPVVLTKTDGFWDERHLYDQQQMLFVPPADSSAVSAAVHRLVNNAADREKMGRQARMTVAEHYTVNHFAERLLKMSRRAVGSGME